jgi:hypothetical protein
MMMKHNYYKTIFLWVGQFVFCFLFVDEMICRQLPTLPNVSYTTGAGRIRELLRYLVIREIFLIMKLVN